MMIWYIIAALAIISVLWAVWSLRGQLKSREGLEEAQKELSKGRVVFQNESSPSSS